MQLAAFLASVRQHASAYTVVSALYTATSEAHRDSYLALVVALRGAMVPESSFRDDLISLLDQASYTVFHTDDDVFFRSFPPAAPFSDEVCFSLRVSLNRPTTTPRHGRASHKCLSRGGRLVGVGVVSRDRFAYPLSLNGHIFRTEDVRWWLGAVEFANPNELESRLQ